MPTRVTNIVCASPATIAGLSKDQALVDFEAVLPVPLGLRSIDTYHPEDIALASYLYAPAVTAPGDPRSDSQKRGMRKWDKHRFDNFLLLLMNLRDCGHADDTMFKWDTWGTKDNAEEVFEVNGGVKFETLWAAPHPVMHALSRMFPEDTIQYAWASECGKQGVRFYRHGVATVLEVEDPAWLNDQVRENYWRYCEDVPFKTTPTVQPDA